MNVLNFLDAFGYLFNTTSTDRKNILLSKLAEGWSHNINKRNIFLRSYPKRKRPNKQIMYKNITITTVVSGMAFRSYKHAVNTNS